MNPTEAAVPRDVGRAEAHAAFVARDLGNVPEPHGIPPVVAHDPRRRGLRAFVLGTLLAAATVPTACAEAPAASVVTDDRLLVHWSSPVLEVEVSMAWLATPCVRRPLMATILDDIVDTVRAVEEEDWDEDYVLSPRNAPRWSRTRMELAFEHERLVSVLVEASAYTGGAHGFHGTSSVIVDKESCEEIPIDRVLDWKRAASALAPALGPALAAAKRMRGWLRPGEQVRLAPGDVAQASVGLLSGPGGRSCGLRLDFPPYALGPFAEGAYTLLVPAGQVAPFVRPEWRDLFVPARSEACRDLPGFIPDG